MSLLLSCDIPTSAAATSGIHCTELVEEAASDILKINLLSKFEIATEEQPRVKKWVFDKICQFWKNWKSKLKKTHYDPFHTTRKRL
ncbi:hypothetical protein MRB53_005975 [Persea americana]|uniref:Uncharacterized protein n=1 Tax=Persea americana TaxID=3435 RepID=A0ACC2MEV4_PERAE|nr:hypothetical protein MRB53_005975 [Persea americana]